MSHQIGFTIYMGGSMKLKTHVLGMRLKQPFCGPWPDCGREEGMEGGEEGGREVFHSH